jgi:hypothetical protein
MQRALEWLRRAARDLRALVRMPEVTIDLMLRDAAGNDPFYAGLVRDYYASTRRRYARFPLVRVDGFGVALLRLPATFDEYFMAIEAAGRRNFKKAARNGYRFERVDYNARLDDIAAIWRSADVRQGRVPEYMRQGQVRPCRNPPSRTDAHDYPYFGVFKDGRLVAYAGCLVSGEVCMFEHIFGHAAHQAEGVVPMLLIGAVRYVREHYPRVRFCTYDTYLGASRKLRRFKRKFGFLPHRVQWVLG